MKAYQFINKYLKQDTNLVIELHSPTNYPSITFSIEELNKAIDVTKEEGDWFECEVSQISSNIQTYDNALRVVIHIYILKKKKKLLRRNNYE